MQPPPPKASTMYSWSRPRTTRIRHPLHDSLHHVVPRPTILVEHSGISQQYPFISTMQFPVEGENSSCSPLAYQGLCNASRPNINTPTPPPTAQSNTLTAPVFLSRTKACGKQGKTHTSCMRNGIKLKTRHRQRTNSRYETEG